ncbi:hypothetical protein SDRG_09880 [Saprolegnia diclina VS20]|uniref:Uncharacterized protein n=1 Tax=Saprolegnia diclina (strain VS20) TaxID=1156394 RepID=T0QCY1_SAPDV|nr:hypothetical protein SDRG_09880 [Saprolegnia diclina VS20]EQC32561.1 hypothetical protein SDRG_09880 [Saprolegnia diclina VS20]|eukprot:XP_008614062.1 hypothetical protein SDRG_09880 [Saprolegnia diclina VS20]
MSSAAVEIGRAERLVFDARCERRAFDLHCLALEARLRAVRARQADTVRTNAVFLAAKLDEKAENNASKQRELQEREEAAERHRQIEARRLADQEAKRTTDQEAKRAADQEAKRTADQEAKRAAEEAARQRLRDVQQAEAAKHAEQSAKTATKSKAVAPQQPVPMPVDNEPEVDFGGGADWDDNDDPYRQYSPPPSPAREPVASIKSSKGRKKTTKTSRAPLADAVAPTNDGPKKARKKALPEALSPNASKRDVPAKKASKGKKALTVLDESVDDDDVVSPLKNVPTKQRKLKESAPVAKVLSPMDKPSSFFDRLAKKMAEKVGPLSPASSAAHPTELKVKKRKAVTTDTVPAGDDVEASKKTKKAKTSAAAPAKKTQKKAKASEDKKPSKKRKAVDTAAEDAIPSPVRNLKPKVATKYEVPSRGVDATSTKTSLFASFMSRSKTDAAPVRLPVPRDDDAAASAHATNGPKKAVWQKLAKVPVEKKAQKPKPPKAQKTSAKAPPKPVAADAPPKPSLFASFINKASAAIPQLKKPSTN